MSTSGSPLGYIDSHSLRVDASRAEVWAALERRAATIGLPRGTPLATLLGTEPPRGFELGDRVEGERLDLCGRHRFARYRISFALDDEPDGTTRLTAHSYATFDGVHGRAYRALVIGTRLHVLATTRLLRSVRRATRPAGGASPGD